MGGGVTTSDMLLSCLELLPLLPSLINRMVSVDVKHHVCRFTRLYRVPLELLPLHTVVRCPSFLWSCCHFTRLYGVLPSSGAVATSHGCTVSFLPLELLPLHTVVRCPSFLWSCCHFTRLYRVLPSSGAVATSHGCTVSFLPSSGAVATSHGCTVSFLPLELLPLHTVVPCPSFLPLELLPLHTVVRCPSFLWSCWHFTRLYRVLPLELLPLHTVVRCPSFLWSCCHFTRLYDVLPSPGAVATSHGCTMSFLPLELLPLHTVVRCPSFLPLELLPLHTVVRCVTASFIWRSVHRCLLFSAAKPLGWTQIRLLSSPAHYFPINIFVGELRLGQRLLLHTQGMQVKLLLLFSFSPHLLPPPPHMPPPLPPPPPPPAPLQLWDNQLVVRAGFCGALMAA